MAYTSFFKARRKVHAFNIQKFFFDNQQASGRAVYINDIAGQPGECQAAFVLSTAGNAKIQSIDPTEALVIPNNTVYCFARTLPNFKAEC